MHLNDLSTIPLTGSRNDPGLDIKKNILNNHLRLVSSKKSKTDRVFNHHISVSNGCTSDYLGEKG